MIDATSSATTALVASGTAWAGTPHFVDSEPQPVLILFQSAAGRRVIQFVLVLLEWRPR